MILVDTCGLLALQDGSEAFSKSACQRLEEPGSKVYVSAITAFEIGQKHASGKLVLPISPQEWFEAMLRQHRIEELPVTSSIGIAAAALPLIHRDPFDRILVATALAHHLTILTSDRIIPEYPGIETVW
jgi:PIN domain nuclease of toxin-antitoxin system